MLFRSILPQGAEWLEWCSIHSGIGIQHRKTRTFYILVILIPEFWIKKRALSLSVNHLFGQFGLRMCFFPFSLGLGLQFLSLSKGREF